MGGLPDFMCKCRPIRLRSKVHVEVLIDAETTFLDVNIHLKGHKQDSEQ